MIVARRSCVQCPSSTRVARLVCGTQTAHWTCSSSLLVEVSWKPKHEISYAFVHRAFNLLKCQCNIIIKSCVSDIICSCYTSWECTTSTIKRRTSLKLGACISQPTITIFVFRNVSHMYVKLKLSNLVTITKYRK